MAELVEEGFAIVPAHQDRLASFSADEVGVVRDDGRDFAIEAFLVAVGVHPGTRLLSRTGVGVEIPETDVTAPSILHLPHPDLGLYDGRAHHRGESEPEELASHPDH